MIFSTPAFLFLFLPPVLLVGLFLKKEAQNYFLLLASLVFYAWGEGWMVMLLLGSALINHIFGLGIERAGAAARKKTLLIAALAFNLLFLIAFKYAHFLFANLEPLLKILGMATGNAPAWRMPLGISFFTFMAMTYLLEVYNHSIPAERNFLHTALAIAMFPTVLAGPINRYSRLRQQLAEREVSADSLAQGVSRFIVGLGKKVLLADTLAQVADQVFTIPVSGLTAPIAWLGALAYLLQILFDFSGYSDMAIGLGRMFGFTFMENFNYPYMAKTISEFWTRWHISLSSWLRDFIFLPVAYAISRRLPESRFWGIRSDAWCYYPAMLLTMLLCGLWHGAAWTFIAWGLYHGSFIMLERFALKKLLSRLWPPLQAAYALLVVAFGWVLFRAADFSQASAYWRALLGFGAGDGKEYYPALYLNAKVIAVMAAASLAIFPLLPALRAGMEKRNLAAGYRLLAAMVLLGVLLASAMTMASATFNPFIYFRF